MNEFNKLHGDKRTDPPNEWNSKTPPAHLKYRTYLSKTIPVGSAIMARLNHHAIDNGDVEVHPSDFKF